MKRVFILLGLLVVLCDLADCTILGAGGFSDFQSQNRSPFGITLTHDHHTKVFPGHANFNFGWLPVILPNLGILPDLPGPVVTTPVALEFPNSLKQILYTNASSSGGIPL